MPLYFASYSTGLHKTEFFIELVTSALVLMNWLPDRQKWRSWDRTGGTVTSYSPYTLGIMVPFTAVTKIPPPPKPFRLALRPIQPPTEWVLVTVPLAWSGQGMKLTIHPLSNTTFRNEWNYTSTPLCAVVTYLRAKKQDNIINSV